MAVNGALPATLDAILFDAGGVLIDLDYAYLQRLIRASHAAVPRTALSEAESHARREINETVRGGGNVRDAWRDYFHVLLARVGVPGRRHETIIDSLWEAHQRVGLWTVACDGAVEVVGQLKARGLRLGVVSNAEGQVEQHLEAAGFGGLFETVVDSHLVGVAKPDPAIFRIALERMALAPERTLFVGDLPAVDVAGARAAGLAAVLLDRHGLYPDVNAPRIARLADLAGLLGSGEGS
jgi:putative hydrolase of the HAD superfamily